MRIAKQWSHDLPAPAKLLPRLILLTAIKEGYLLVANSYGLLFHPYLTLKKIKNDKSQTLIFGSSWLLVLLVLLLAQRVYQIFLAQINIIPMFVVYFLGIVRDIALVSFVLATVYVILVAFKGKR